MINMMLIMNIFTFLFKNGEVVEINHDYLDSQINISVSNFSRKTIL